MSTGKKKRADKVEKYLKDCFIISTIILALSCMIFRHYVFGGYYFLSKENLGDLLRSTLPAYYHLYDNLFGGSGGFWSWRMGIGTSMFTHGDIFFDPFTYIAFLGGRVHIPDMLVWLYIVKLVAEGICFYFFIDYFRVDRRAAVIASVCYAFSGYSIITGDFFALATIMVFFPLICLGIERWLDGKGRKVLIASLFLTGVYSFYFYYQAGILAGVYLIVRYCIRESGVSVMENLKVLLRKLVSLALMGAIALGMAAFSALPQIDQMMRSARVAGAGDVKGGAYMLKPYISTLATAIIRTVGMNTLFGVDGSYEGKAFTFSDYYQVTTFVSAFFFVFMILIIIRRRHEKKALGAIVGTGFIICLLISAPFFSYAENAFSTVNYRWLFSFSLVGASVVALALNDVVKNGIPSQKDMFLSVIASAVMLASSIGILAIKNGNALVSVRDICKGSRSAYLAILIAWGILLVFTGFFGGGLKKHAHSTDIYLALLTLLICADIAANCSYMYGNEENSLMEYTEANQANYMDSSADIIRELMKEDRSFYRLNKDFDSVVCSFDQNSCNDAMVQGYYGLKSYNSMNNKNYINYLWKNDVYVTPEANVEDYKKLGVAPNEVWNGQELNYIEGLYDRYDLMDYLGVKYYLTRNKEKKLPESYELIEEYNDILVYRNRNAYPLAFTESEPPQDMQQRFTLHEFKSDNVKFSLDVDADGSEVTFSMPYDRDWHILVDGTKSDAIQTDNYLLGCMLDAGSHEIQLKYYPTALFIGLIISIAAGMIYAVMVIAGQAGENSRKN